MSSTVSACVATISSFVDEPRCDAMIAHLATKKDTKQTFLSGNQAMTMILPGQTARNAMMKMKRPIWSNKKPLVFCVTFTYSAPTAVESCGKTGLLLSFPYICPEPVLAK